MSISEISKSIMPSSMSSHFESSQHASMNKIMSIISILYSYSQVTEKVRSAAESQYTDIRKSFWNIYGIAAATSSMIRTVGNILEFMLRLPLVGFVFVGIFGIHLCEYIRHALDFQTALRTLAEMRSDEVLASPQVEVVV